MNYFILPHYISSNARDCVRCEKEIEDIKEPGDGRGSQVGVQRTKHLRPCDFSEGKQSRAFLSFHRFSESGKLKNRIDSDSRIFRGINKDEVYGKKKKDEAIQELQLKRMGLFHPFRKKK